MGTIAFSGAQGPRARRGRSMSEYWNRASLEIVLSRDSAKVKQKLRELYDPAISKLLAEPTVKFDFESGRVIINTPIATEANLGPYTIKVQPVTPNHLSGTIRPETVNVRVPTPQPNQDVAKKPTAHTTKWERMVNERGYVVALVSFVVYAFCGAALLIAGKGTTMKPSTTSIPPFIHKIDYRNVSRES